MKKTLLLGLISAISAVGCGGVQTPPACAVGRSDVSNYVVSYTLKDGQPACAATQHLDSNWTLAIQKYSGAAGSGQKDVALRPAFSDYWAYAYLNSRFQSFALESTDDHAAAPSIAYATLDTETPVTEGSETFCNVSSFTKGATGKVDGTASGTLFGSADLDGKDVDFEFGATKFLDSAQYPGTQVSTEVTYTEGTCTAEYSAVGVWPWSNCYTIDACGEVLDTDGNAIFLHDDDCNFTDVDADENPNFNPAFGAVGFQDNLCDQDFVAANSDDTQVHNYNVGGTALLSTGVNPSYALTCDHASGYCVPAKAFPSFK